MFVKRGFTLVEVLISITLIAIAMLGVMGSIAYGTKHSSSAEELTEATQIARSILTYMEETTLIDVTQTNEDWPTAESGINDIEPTARHLLTDAPFGGMNFKPEQVGRFFRRVTCERVKDKLSDGSIPSRYNLARVRVQIFFQSKQGERNVDLTGILQISRD